MLDNKTEQKWPLAKEAKAEFVKGHFFLSYWAHRQKMRAEWQAPPIGIISQPEKSRDLKNKEAAVVSSQLPPQPFSCVMKKSPSSMAREEKGSAIWEVFWLVSQSMGLSAFSESSNDWLSSRQAISTLTAPAAWGIAPRSLVQPRHLHGCRATRSVIYFY